MRIAVVGLGSAGIPVARAVASDPRDELVGGVDVDDEARRWFIERFDRPAVESIDALHDRVGLDAVWIATPTPYREADTSSAAARGIHVLVDKPMAMDIPTAERMIAACEQAGVALVCGGSRSSSSFVRGARSVLRSGRVGPVRAMTTIAATDWLLRPRRPDELEVSSGGGVVLRQAPHLIDTYRLLGGGIVRQVRAVADQWMPNRGSAPGYVSAILEMDDGVTATCTYNGHGYFLSDEVLRYGGEPEAAGVHARVARRREIEHGEDLAAKRARLARLRAALDDATPVHEPFFPELGLTIVHGERGDLRQSPRGLYVYDDDGVSELELSAPVGSPPEVDELRAALADDAPLLHSGAWGLATLEVCLGMLTSARDRVDVAMSRQVAVPNGW